MIAQAIPVGERCARFLGEPCPCYDPTAVPVLENGSASQGRGTRRERTVPSPKKPCFALAASDPRPPRCRRGNERRRGIRGTPPSSRRPGDDPEDQSEERPNAESRQSLPSASKSGWNSQPPRPQTNDRSLRNFSVTVVV